MKVLTEAEFTVITGDVYPDITKKWIDNATNNAELANERRKTRIKRDADYEELIAEASQRGYKGYVNPDFISRAGLNKDEIMSKHYKNITAGWKKYQNKLDYLFETVDGIPAKRYKEIIQRTAEHYGKNVAEKLLAFTGTKVHGRGCAVQVLDWLDGDPTLSKLSNINIIKGGPIILAKPGLRSSFRSSLENRLVQAGATIRRGDYSEAVCKKQNDTTNDLLNGFANPALNLEPFATGGDSHADFRMAEEGAFRIYVKVSSRT